MILTNVKIRFFVLLLSLLSAAASAAHAGIIYSGIQRTPIPLNFEGEYLRIDTGTTSGAYPADWETAPWINPFFGGVFIGNSPLLRPIVTGTDQILNLAVGTVIGSESNFVAGEGGSSTHMGIGPGQFAPNTPGYIGVDFRTTTGGPDYFGWIEMTISNDGAGEISSWAYENVSGTAIEAGDIGAIPEPGTVYFGLLLIAIRLCGRNREAQARSFIIF
jgi:hypothetical protein